MTKGLIIVESPTKARTIQKYVGKDFKVLASVGHIKDLPKNRLGVNVEDGFKPEYEILKGKANFLKEIKKAAKDVTDIYLASDPDREGEAIAWHIAEEIEGPGKRIYRALFNDLSKETVLGSLMNPTKLDRRKVEAQMARRILDRLVGYEISPILWQKVKRGLSAGRVQSVAVRLVCERQREIDSFVPEEYWTIEAKLEAHEPPPFSAKLIKVRGEKLVLGNESDAKRVLNELQGLAFIVGRVETRPQKRRPPAPFTTSKLQQEAFRRLKFSPKRTMVLAQQLYEGVDLGPEGPVGLITYMRTDSVRVAPNAIEAVRGYIKEMYGQDYLPSKPQVYKSRKGAQEAHEAIRPTSVERHPELVKPHLTQDQYSLYKLIWERFVASQMKAAVYNRTVVEVEAGPYTFRATGSVLAFPGFTILYGHEVDGEVADEEALFPPLNPGEALRLLELFPEQHFTQPPPPFTEATLVKELEERGIGRPSTYATILANIQERGYVKVEKGTLRPTELGFLVTDLLVESFPGILDVGFTAEMEDKLDKIEEGQLDRLSVLREFYGSFQEDFQKAEKEMRDLKREGLPTDLRCQECGSLMVVKVGRKGPFLSCSAYPECTFSMPYTREASRPDNQTGSTESRTCPRCEAPMVLREGRYGPFWACTSYPSCRSTAPVDGRGSEGSASEEGGPPCPLCGSEMVLKKGRFGPFYACSRYPDCRGTSPLEVGLTCPVENCGGRLLERRSKRGKTYYTCSRYPRCRFILWERPVAKPCPRCQAPFMVEKTTRGRHTLYCLNERCRYEEEA